MEGLIERRIKDGASKKEICGLYERLCNEALGKEEYESIKNKKMTDVEYMTSQLFPSATYGKMPKGYMEKNKTHTHPIFGDCIIG